MGKSREKRMKLTEIFKQNKYSLSFEVFPPKTDDVYDSVKHATEEIARLSPAFMSVTYGAGGGTSRYTLDIAKNIKTEYGVPSLAHLTCVSSTRETVAARIADFKEAGIVFFINVRKIVIFMLYNNTKRTRRRSTDGQI